MLAQLEPPENENDQYKSRLAFVEALLLDRVGRQQEAWEKLEEARSYDGPEMAEGYKADQLRRKPLLDLVGRAPVDISAKSKPGEEWPVSLFIVGPSRSGKTTLESLLGTLKGVQRGYENPIVENAVRQTFKASGLPTRSALIELPPKLGGTFRTHYREELLRRAQGAAVLTNTLPGRIEDALRIAAEIPQSRFVFVKRNPYDLALRIRMRHYRQGNLYASRLEDTFDYLSWCHEMIDRTAEKLPNSSVVIDYEQMVENPYATLSKAAALCGLPTPSALTKLPRIGDDRGCSSPYRQFLRVEPSA